MRTAIRLLFLLSAFAVGAQDSALVDTNGVLVHPTNFLSANGIAPLASPALSGNPTAPTETAGDNDTSISTTAFVTAALEALKALQLWQNTNAVLTTLANLTGGTSSNFFRGSGAFAQVTTNDIPELVAALNYIATSAANADNLTSGTISSNRLADSGVAAGTYSNLVTAQIDAKGRVMSVSGSTDAAALTNLQSANLAGTLSSNVLPGLLSGLSVGNGQGVVTNIAYQRWIVITNLTYTPITTNIQPPSWARWMFVECQGGGGGGGSGGCFPDNTASSGGAGGSGGAHSKDWIELDSLPQRTNLYVIIGGRGQGGASQVTNNASGLNGTDGGDASVRLSTPATNALVSAGGGGYGSGGTTTAGAVRAANRLVGYWAGSSGGAGDDLVGANGGSGGSSSVATGGAGGGGVSSTNVPFNGGTGGGVIFLGGLSTAGLNNGTAPGGAGSSESELNRIVPSRGGGGGAGGTNVIGGAGGSGWFGGGGGGGGGGRDGYYSGPGGDGGGGYVKLLFVQCAFPAAAAPQWIGATARWTYDTVSFLRNMAIKFINYESEKITQ